MEAIRAAVAADAVFVGDVAVCNHRGSNYCLEVYDQRTYMTPAWGGLGFGLPAAAGAAVGHRGVAVVGGEIDGGGER